MFIIQRFNKQLQLKEFFQKELGNKKYSFSHIMQDVYKFKTYDGAFYATNTIKLHEPAKHNYIFEIICLDK